MKIIQQNAGGRRRLSPRRLDVIRERSARGYDLVKMIEDNKNGRRRLLENPDDDPRVKISDWHGREFRKLSKDLGHTLHPIEIEEEAAEHKEHVEKIGVSLDLLESKVQYLQQLVHRVAAVKM